MVFPASGIQQAFWASNRLHSESSAYSIASVFKITGSLDKTALEKSIHNIINRHTALRTSFDLVDNEVCQVIHESFRPELHFIDLQSETFSDLNGLLQEIVNAPFDLKTTPPLRTTLIKTADKEHVLAFVLHHILIDMESKKIFGSELSYLYNHFLSDAGDPRDLPVSDYTSFSLRESGQTRYDRMKDFWQKNLAEYSGFLNLPIDFARPPMRSEHGEQLPLFIDAGLSKRIRDFSANEKVSSFTTALAAYFLLLRRLTAQNDLVVGVPFTNRLDNTDMAAIGCFVNILPVAVSLSGEESFTTLLRNVRNAMLLAHRNRMLPYNQIVKAVCPQHDPRYNPLFQAGFTFEQPMPLQLTGCTVNNVVVPKTASQLDIFTNLWEIDGSLQGHFEYNTDLFKKETVLRFVDYYSRLLQSATDNPLENIDILAMLSHIEEHTVTKQWNDSHRQYDSTKCLHELFEHQAAKTPTRKAVVFRDQSLSYEALNQKANKLAWKLHSMGAGPDKIVALHMDRSLEMVIGLYAILKSGAAYLPIEPGLPLLRKQFMVKDAQPVTIISDKRYAENLPDMPCPTLVIDVNLELGDTCSADKVVTGVSPRNLAYCIYTSGSTGNPKGVLIEHQGICNRLQWMQEYFDLKADDRILQKTPFGFDVSVWEFFWPLISGATLVVAEPGGHHDNAYMTRTIQNEKISVVHFVPSMLEIFLTDPQSTECSTLRYVICSGEALPFGLQERFFAALPHCRLFNLYGPTEASVDVTYWKCRTGYAKNVVPIGFPVANTQLYVLNEKLQPAPIGVTGNLYIGGIQLARGYLNRDDLTKGRFISDPFGDGAGTRLYDTGDLARWLPDGAIEYLGRKDFQIKFHGVRIEAAEIEMAILQHPAIARALVCAQGLGEGMQLIAYITYKQSPGCTTEEIRSFLRQRISQSIIPSIFVVLEVFPMTPNGKIYRKALPVPQPTKPLPKAMPIGLNSIEQRIMTIWKHYLPLESIDVHRNFFEIGGTSFLLIQINQRLREQFDIEISMVEMFQYPSIALLSDFIKDNKIAESGTDALDGRKQKQQRALEKIRKLKGKG